MRKILEAIALAALGAQAWLTYSALLSPESLPQRFPMHFDAAGNANAWGSRATLLVVPAVAITIYLLFTVVTRFPSAFNYPVVVTLKNRARLQTLALNMIAWLKMELICLFTWIQWATIQVARHPRQQLPASLMPITLVAVFSTIAFYTVAMFTTKAGGPD
jgi:uncharacterized membrane protein